jgi:hypothetical protein
VPWVGSYGGWDDSGDSGDSIDPDFSDDSGYGYDPSYASGYDNSGAPADQSYSPYLPPDPYETPDPGEGYGAGSGSAYGQAYGPGYGSGYAPGPGAQSASRPPYQAFPGQNPPLPRPVSVPANQQTVTLVFKDHRPNQQIHNYLLNGTMLSVWDQHPREIPVDQIDVPATEKLNNAAGVDFHLPVESQ